MMATLSHHTWNALKANTTGFVAILIRTTGIYTQPNAVVLPCQT